MSAMTHPNNNTNIHDKQFKRHKSDSYDKTPVYTTNTTAIHTSVSTPHLTRTRTPLIYPTGEIDSTGICCTSHVTHRRASADSPPTPSLVGRQFQRYDGKVRLVCGCVPFRLDLIDMDSVAQISPIPQPVPVAPPLLVESETSDTEQSDTEQYSKQFVNGVKIIDPQPRILTTDDSNNTTHTHNDRTNSNSVYMNSTINTTPVSSPTNSRHNSTASPTTNIPLPENKRLQLCVLLIRASHKEQWVFPKGGWENFETAQQCAQRESLEEAGVEGIIVAELGSIEFIRKGKKARLMNYLLQVTQQHEVYSELHRNRQWVPVEQCRELLSRSESIHAFDQAVTVWKALGLIQQNSCQTVQQRTYSTGSDDNDSVILHSSSAPAIVKLNNGESEQLVETSTIVAHNNVINKSHSSNSVSASTVDSLTSDSDKCNSNNGSHADAVK